MPSKKEPLQAIERFLPKDTFEKILPHLRAYPLHLAITRERRSVQGSYHAPLHSGLRHRISINGNLNPYSFLVTLLHELAHLHTFIQYNHQVQPHGPEWKNNFKNLLADFLNAKIFPEAIHHALLQYLGNIKASTCTDPHLYKTLKQFDTVDTGRVFVEEIPEGQHFALPDGRVLQKLEKLRTRYRCKELRTGNIYMVPAIMEVNMV